MIWITLEVLNLLGKNLQKLSGGTHPLGNRLPEAPENW